MVLPGGQRIDHFAGGGVGGMKHAAGIEKSRGRFLPEIAMPGQIDVIEAEAGHERGVVRGEEVSVVAQTEIGGRDVLGVVVGGAGRGAVGIVDERALQFVGNDAEDVAIHLRQGVDAGLNADAIGRGDKDAVGDEAHLVGAGDDPLGIGGGEMGVSRSTRVPRCAVSTIWRAVSCGLSSAGCGPSRSFETHSGWRAKQAPVVGDADGVDGVDVRAGLGVGIDEAALIVGAGDHGGDAHVEVGVGLGLRVHAGIAVDEAGNEKFSGAIDDARAFGDWHFAGQADRGDFAFADDDNGIGNVAGRVAPIGDIDDRAAGKNQGAAGSAWGWAETEAKANPQTSAARERQLRITKSV